MIKYLSITAKMGKMGYFWSFLSVFAVVQTRHEWYTPFLIISDIYLLFWSIIGACTNQFQHLKCEIIAKTIKLVNFGHFCSGKDWT